VWVVPFSIRFRYPSFSLTTARPNWDILSERHWIKKKKSKREKSAAEIFLGQVEGPCAPVENWGLPPFPVAAQSYFHRAGSAKCSLGVPRDAIRKL
jgi:hypothetical protein